MKKITNWRMESIDYEPENIKETLNLDQAVEMGILEKVDNFTWRARA